ncbi:MAG: [FeFe] hydrogenase H-cluster maturation GTPase HydF [Bacteroidales bacterium]|nr:[FeFe] hydrogenase H-cluster maturation GTPase HydF [Bacteroidales bacterium]
MNKGKEARPHIGIFGRRNNGKSSFINVLSGQEAAIVSDVAGTTTDPVKKSMEIPGIGPCVLIDTAGIDDEGALGQKRVAKTIAAIQTVDLAILVLANNAFGEPEKKLIDSFSEYNIPWIVMHTRSDLVPSSEGLRNRIETEFKVPFIEFSNLHPNNLNIVVSIIVKTMPESAWKSTSLLGDLLSYGDLVLLITPIDIEAPEGRLILPQVQAIRDILENDCVSVVVKEKEVDALLKVLSPRPKLAITDSQVFLKAAASVPPEIPLTSFSIMLARHKGDFANYLKGTPMLGQLKDNDRVLILESCSHHVSCDDIGRTKIPRWLGQYSGKKLEFDVVSGLTNIPRSIKDYAIVIQCGGCVLTRKQIISRLKPAVDAGVPVTNYGMAIAWMHGIYQRAVAPFVKIDSSGSDFL